jgi:hypothetical protein
MQYISGQPRQQTFFATLDEQVSSDNPVRLIDVFVDKLDLQRLGFQKTIHKSEGRPPYVKPSPISGKASNPLVRGWQNYYCYFIKRDLNDQWRFVNRRLEKWCKWNKRMNLRKSRRWLNTLYKLQPGLFAHWRVCPAY